jgi:hypothetical protein
VNTGTFHEWCKFESIDLFISPVTFHWMHVYQSYSNLRPCANKIQVCESVVYGVQISIYMAHKSPMHLLCGCWLYLCARPRGNGVFKRADHIPQATFIRPSTHGDAQLMHQQKIAWIGWTKWKKQPHEQFLILKTWILRDIITGFLDFYLFLNKFSHSKHYVTYILSCSRVAQCIGVTCCSAKVARWGALRLSGKCGNGPISSAWAGAMSYMAGKVGVGGNESLGDDG